MNRMAAGLAVCAMFGIPAFAAAPTFSRDTAPILYKHCAGCHHPNDIAPMSLLTYKEARPWAASIREAVVRRKMPPWKADPHVGKWSNDPSLSNDEIAVITAWVDGGKLWLYIYEGSLVFIRPGAPVIDDGCAVDDNGWIEYVDAGAGSPRATAAGR